MDGEELLKAHERHSAERSAHLEKLIERLEGIKMGHEGMTDTVTNVFKPAGHDGMLGGGLGAGLVGGILGGLLFGRRGLGGDCDTTGVNGLNNVNDAVFNTAILTKLGSIEAAVPLAEAQTQNAILAQTGQLTTMMTANANAAAIATGAVKDSVQQLALFLSNQINAVNSNVSDQGCKTRETVQATSTAILEKINANTIAQLQAELAEQRGRWHARDTEVNITQTVNQAQAQSQFQQQQQRFEDERWARLIGSFNQVMAARQGQDVINFGGTMTASGTQAAANTQVR